MAAAAFIAAAMSGAPSSETTPPTWVSAGTPASGTASLTTLGLPPGRSSGDLLLLLIQNDNASSSGGHNPADNAYPGWTIVGRQPTTSSGASSARITVYYAWSQDISVAPTIAHTGEHQSAVILAYRGVNPTNPFNAVGGGVQNSATSAVSMAGVTTSDGNCRVLYLLTNNSDAVGTDWVSVDSSPNLADVNFTHAARFNQKWNAGTGGGLAVIDGVLVAAGASGAVGGTQNTVNSYRWLVIALEPTP